MSSVLAVFVAVLPTKILSLKYYDKNIADPTFMSSVLAVFVAVLPTKILVSNITTGIYS